MQKQLRAGYYSAVTHTDRLFGNVMDALDGSGVADDTFGLVTGVRRRCFLRLIDLLLLPLESVGVSGPRLAARREGRVGQARQL